MKNTNHSIGFKLTKEQLEAMLVGCLSTTEGLNQLTEALINALWYASEIASCYTRIVNPIKPMVFEVSSKQEQH